MKEKEEAGLGQSRASNNRREERNGLQEEQAWGPRGAMVARDWSGNRSWLVREAMAQTGREPAGARDEETDARQEPRSRGMEQRQAWGLVRPTCGKGEEGQANRAWASPSSWLASAGLWSGLLWASFWAVLGQILSLKKKVLSPIKAIKTNTINKIQNKT